MDGLTELFSGPQAANPPSNASSMNAPGVSRTLPLRSQFGSVPGRLPPSAAPSERNINVTRSPKETGIATRLHFSGRGTTALDGLERDIAAVIEQQKSSLDDADELLLILDQPDFLLAATGPEMGIGAAEMAEWVTGLQEVGSNTRACF